MLLALGGCVTLHIYPSAPKPLSGLEPALEPGRLTVVASYKRPPSFAYQEGSLFSGYVANVDGFIENVIENEIRRNPNRYMAPGGQLRVNVKDFELRSTESWFWAESKIRIRVAVTRDGRPVDLSASEGGGPPGSPQPAPTASPGGTKDVKESKAVEDGKDTAPDPNDFVHEAKIESHVTEVTGILCTVSLVGLLWYAPYKGFRGSLEDQLNYLGRTTMVKLFQKMELKKEVTK